MSVFISHLPPVVEFGTFTLPVSVSAIKILSERNAPETSPVSVFTYISAASHPLKYTSPVLLSIKNFSMATTLLKIISPVLPLEESVLHSISVNFVLPVETLIFASLTIFMFEPVIVPVETENSRASAEIFSV